MISLPLDSIAAQEFLGELGRKLAQFPGELEKVMVRALNRTMKGAHTQTVKLFMAHYTVKKDHAGYKAEIWSASRSRLMARLVGTGRPILLSRFGASRRTVSRTPSAYTYKRGGKTISVTPQKRRKYNAVSVKVLKSGSRKSVRANGGGWLGKGSHDGVDLIYTRGFDHPGGIGVLRGPSMSAFLNRDTTKATVLHTAEERIRKELLHEAGYRLSKLIK